jgi:hypothetical protein
VQGDGQAWFAIRSVPSLAYDLVAGLEDVSSATARPRRVKGDVPSGAEGRERREEAMYETTALAELDRVDARFSERESFSELEEVDRVERFLWAVSSGWPQVMSFLESCDLDREAREILRHLRQDD